MYFIVFWFQADIGHVPHMARLCVAPRIDPRLIFTADFDFDLDFDPSPGFAPDCASDPAMALNSESGFATACQLAHRVLRPRLLRLPVPP